MQLSTFAVCALFRRSYVGLRQVRSKEEMKNTAAHPIGVEWAVPKASKVAMRESKARAAIAKAEGDET